MAYTDPLNESVDDMYGLEDIVFSVDYARRQISQEIRTLRNIIIGVIVALLILTVVNMVIANREQDRLDREMERLCDEYPSLLDC